MEKYPRKFSEAEFGVVLKTYQGDGLLFEGVCRIVRRPAGMIAIENRRGSTFTFTIETDSDGKEYGTIGNARRPGEQCTDFKVIPYNRLL